MVGRAEKAKKYVRWAFYFAAGPRQQKGRDVLKAVAEAGKVQLQVVEVSASRMDVTWPKAVTWNSAWRLSKLAAERDPDFCIIGDPHGILDEDESRAIESEEKPTATPPLPKRVRRTGKTSVPPAAAVNPATPRPPLTPARTPMVPAASSWTVSVQGTSTKPGAASSWTVSVQGNPTTPGAASSLCWLPPCLMPLKWEEMLDQLSQSKHAVQDSAAYDVEWETPLGEGSFGVVYPGRVRGTEQRVAVKVMTWDKRRNAELEMHRCVAVAGHPDIVKVLDVASFRRRPLPAGDTPGRCLPVVALVFDRFETTVCGFSRGALLEIAAVRHILRKVVSALMYMHDLGIVHADLKPPNILMRPELFAVREWRQWIDSSSKGHVACFRGCISPKGCIFKVVLGDLGNVELAEPALRMQPRLNSGVVEVCTEPYRPPDLYLGNTNWRQDLDMWSLGCVAAELLLRRPLFWAAGRSYCASDYLKQHLSRLGRPGVEALGFLENLQGLPCDLDVVRRAKEGTQPSRELLDVLRPRHMADFVGNCLEWDPRVRMTAASATVHPFLSTPSLDRTVSAEEGKHGPSSICSGFLDEEVLDYLQNCPSLAQLRDECLSNDFEPSNKSISEAEGRRRMKREFPGYVPSANEPPVCKHLNGEAVGPIRSERIAFFARALRKCASGWLHQLQERVRVEIRRVGLPWRYLSNARVFMDEQVSDNAFVYATVQVCKVGAREDGWHTDGGASLLHAGLTIFGSRQMQVRFPGRPGCISLEQRPGSFYVGNLCALEHNVVHGETAPGSWDDIQIMVMFRSDFFREARSRKINACPGPQELFRIVNMLTARHLAEVPFPVPDIAAVISECPREGDKAAASACKPV